MVPLACLMHWYISMMYVVPVVAVGGWGWLSSRRMARRKAAAAGTGARETELEHSQRSFSDPVVH